MSRVINNKRNLKNEKKLHSKFQGIKKAGKKEYLKIPENKPSRKENSKEYLRFAAERFVKKQNNGEGSEMSKELKFLILTHKDFKEILLDEIKKAILEINPEAEQADIYIQNGEVQQILNAIRVQEFITKEYENKPYLLKSESFVRLINCPKAKIATENISQFLPCYTLANDFSNTTDDKVGRKVRVFSDNSFFLSDDKKILIAKTIKLGFKDCHKEKDIPENVEEGLRRQSLRRVFSVAMYGLLDGNAKSIELFMRIDDDKHNHNNFFLHDERDVIYGEKVGYPHIHFQNETDQFLCRKMSGTEHTTGRCNAIDVKNLKKYLRSLAKTDIEIRREASLKNHNYGMPFLDMSLDEKRCSKLAETLSIESVFKSVMEYDKESLIQKERAGQFLKEFENYLSNKNCDYGKFKMFGALCKALDLLQFSSDRYWKAVLTKNVEEGVIATKIEMIIANKLVDAICNVHRGFARDANGNLLIIRNGDNEVKVNSGVEAGNEKSILEINTFEEIKTDEEIKPSGEDVEA